MPSAFRHFLKGVNLISDHLPNIRGLIIDMDGVLWRDTEPIGDLPAIFNKIRECGYKLILATNNATRNVTQYQEKLRRFDVEVEDWQIINSALAVGALLEEKYPHGALVYVVGQPSLKSTLEKFNMRVVDESEPDVDVVVASLDFNLTYDKLRHASLLIQSGSFFVGTNPDVTLPTPEGFVPGSGTVISALEIASGVKAKILGKPEPGLYEMALGRLELTPGDILAIGDRLETDIAGAHNAGIHSALVLSGASTQAQARDYDPQPDIVAKDMTELIF
jgi:4-nitrophenyl phosphatase